MREEFYLKKKENLKKKKKENILKLYRWGGLDKMHMVGFSFSTSKGARKTY